MFIIYIEKKKNVLRKSGDIREEEGHSNSHVEKKPENNMNNGKRHRDKHQHKKKHEISQT